MGTLLKFEDYTIAWIAVLTIEAEAAIGVLDRQHDGYFPVSHGDPYSYIGGEINGHNVVVASLPEGENYGVGSSAALASHIKSRFPNIIFALLVGIAAGLPNWDGNNPGQHRDIRLGDVLVCVPDKESTGVVAYDFGSHTGTGFIIHGRQAEIPSDIRSVIRHIRLTVKKPFKEGNELALKLQALLDKDEDNLFQRPVQDSDKLYATPLHVSDSAEAIFRPSRDPSEPTKIWYGRIGSGNSLMRDARRRDELRNTYNLIGLEMEAAGVMNVLPTGVIRGVCDYGDHYKNDQWQPFAAATAAVYAKAILCRRQPQLPRISLNSLTRTQTLETSRSSDTESSTIICPGDRIFVEFKRDNDFVDRPDILNHVFEICSGPAGRAALLGLGGVGKSQLAIECAYRFNNQYPDRWVFWIHASNASRIRESYRFMADRLQLKHEPSTDILKLVSGWLRDQRNGSWFLILDNADDASVFEAGKVPFGVEETILPLAMIPTCNHGRVLVTTRSRNAALSFIERGRDIIRVEPMSESHALALLKTKLDVESMNKEDTDAAPKLVQSLEYLPLAIAQAAAYINRLRPRSSVSKYLTQLEKDADSKMNLLRTSINDLRRDLSASNSILLTWQISFEHIRSSRPSAADLLALMSFCDRQGIPESLVRACEDQNLRTHIVNDVMEKRERRKKGHSSRSSVVGDNGTNQHANQEKFEEDIATLSDYSLISISEEGNVFSMHSLVQLATHYWLHAHEKLEQWRDTFILALHTSLPILHFHSWPTYQMLLPHIDAAAHVGLLQRDYRLRLAWILREAGEYKSQTSSGPSAEKFLVISHDSYNELLGPTAQATLNARLKLGVLYWNMGKNETEMEVFYKELVAQTKETLGEDNWITLSAMRALGQLFAKQSRLKEAEPLLTHILEVAGNTDADLKHCVVSTRASLMSVYLKTEEFEKAELLARQVLDDCVQHWGQNHPRTLRYMQRLARVLVSRRKMEDAIKLGREALALSEKILGPKHEGTIQAVQSLAEFLDECAEGRSKEAVQLYQQALAFWEGKLNSDHPRIRFCLDGLSFSLYRQERYDEAVAVGWRLVNLCLLVHGENHESTCNALQRLMTNLKASKQWAEAEKQCRKLMSCSSKVRGADSEETAYVSIQLGMILRVQQQKVEADEIFKQVIGTVKEFPSVVENLFVTDTELQALTSHNGFNEDFIRFEEHDDPVIPNDLKTSCVSIKVSHPEFSRPYYLRMLKHGWRDLNESIQDDAVMNAD